ncbi:MAG: Zn-ribbon domain-containing OB-fold protein [Acidobacteria bacterium]|nr:MAG: Zn-ribbon domain-containing OB-fold protein [Acidobacteriota bacterium]
MEEWVVHQRIKIPFMYTAGRALTRFLDGLARGEIWATRCASCSRIYVPPLSFCGRCWRVIDEWRQLPPMGELMSYTLVRYPLPEHPDRSPLILGLIQLDGADTNLVHFIGDVAPSEVESVTRVRAVWRDERPASIFAISHFAPIT